MIVDGRLQLVIADHLVEQWQHLAVDADHRHRGSKVADIVQRLAHLRLVVLHINDAAARDGESQLFGLLPKLLALLRGGGQGKVNLLQ